MAILSVRRLRQSQEPMSRLFALPLVVALAILPASTLHAQAEIDQTTRLAALCRTWGLLKYFHPGVTSAVIDWDAALIDAIPRVKAAATKAELNDELLRLVRAAGSEPRLPAGVTADQPETERVYAWLDDATLLDASTRAALKTVRRVSVPLTSRYAKPVANVANPDFSGETIWIGGELPNEAQRLLALFRFWNMVQYYFPNRDIMDRPWDEVLTGAIPQFINATDARTYHLTASVLIANINDTHGATSSPTLTAHWGINTPGIRTRYIESQTVVTTVFSRYIGDADVRVGDVITDVGGVPASELRTRIAPYISSSNEPALQRIIDSRILRTNAATLTLGILRGGSRLTASPRAYAIATISSEEVALNAAQPKWQILDGNVGFVNMGLLLQTDVPAMYAALKDTRAIVFDQRNYPNFTLYVLAQVLNPRAKNFVKFTAPDFRRPGLFEDSVTLQAGPSSPRQDYYRGRVLVLCDERTQSQAEFTIMALRSAPDVIVVGSQTAGADGNVSQIDLPGSIRTFFSGLGVFYADGSPTQRIGIVPDVPVVPTISGIRSGVDEVLQAALALVPR